MFSPKLLGLVVLLVIVFSASGCCHGCGPFPADGIRSTGGLLNPCDANCSENADWIETLKHYTPEQLREIMESDGTLEGYRAKRYP